MTFPIDKDLPNSSWQALKQILENQNERNFKNNLESNASREASKKENSFMSYLRHFGFNVLRRGTWKEEN
jgi:hypothetical protein